MAARKGVREVLFAGRIVRGGQVGGSEKRG
jgi:hypothetical protein